MELELTETQRTIRDTIRSYMTQEIEPLVPDMEAERLPPFAPIRRMVRDLGLGGGPGQIGEIASGSSAEDRLDLFVPPTLLVEISRVCAGLALSYGASVGLAGGNILSKGTPEQKARWGPPLLSFERIGCWCLTEPDAGSAALRDMKTRAVRDGDHFVLDGSKTFITNAPYADVFVVYAKLRDSDRETVQAFIVERDDPGVSTGPPLKKMGFKSSPTGQVFLSDCVVPADRLLGGGIADRDHVWKSLASERLGLQVISYGLMERAFDIALSYARERKQGGQAIGEYQLVQRRLVRMYMALANARTFVYADVLAGRRREQSVADICAGKLYVAEMATFVTHEAIHILAGNGYMEEYVVERLARDAKLVELGGGTTEMQELTAGRWLLDHYGR